MGRPRKARPVASTQPAERIVVPQLPGWAGWLRVPVNLEGEEVRHRVFFGGRGGAKSRSIASELLVRGSKRVERVLCAREFQKSIKDSVKRLLDDEINRLGLGVLGTGFYLSTKEEIRGANGTVFVFHGLHRNENGIRSLEGITLCWVEEARFVSQDSLDALIPTIRQEGSELWWSYNPKAIDDPVDVLFRGPQGPPPGSIVVEVNYYDNPYFPETLRRDMEYDQRRDEDKYRHIWLGKYLQRSEAKVFRNWKVRPFEVPEDAVRRFGADWGFSIDPTVLLDAFIGKWSGEAWESEAVADPDGSVLFIPHEAYEVGTQIDDIPALFAGDDSEMHPTQRRWENKRGLEGIPDARRWKIIADSARPEIISYLEKRGFNIESAAKGAGSVEEGVTFLQNYDICVHPRCVHVADELATYSYKVDKKTNEIFPLLADMDNHCIAEGELVLCERGQVPIEQVTTADRAWTRAGWKRVLFAGQTDVNREIVEVRAGGRSVRCTPDHRLWVCGKGMTRADALRYGDELLIEESSPWQMPKSSSGTAIATDAIRRATGKALAFIFAGRQGTAAPAFFTGTFGRIITGLFPTGIMFTMPTGTPLTTTLRTSNALLLKSIATSTLGAMSGGRGKNFISTASVTSQRHGIGQRKVEQRSGRPAAWLMRDLSRSPKIATIAAKSLCRERLATATSVARTLVNRLQGERAGSTTKRANATNAGEPSRLTVTARHALARAPVQSVRAAAQCARVYDLTVEDCHEFVGGGILVANCIDALRYALENVRKAGSGKVQFASAGHRVTVATLEGSSSEEERVKNRTPLAPTRPSTVGGSGWGSAPGFRQGIL